MNPEKRDRGLLKVDGNECKGCGLCIEACALHVIRMTERLNRYGYKTAEYVGCGCSGCGICYMACPEPGAITVYKLNKPPSTTAIPAANAASTQGATPCASN